MAVIDSTDGGGSGRWWREKNACCPPLLQLECECGAIDLFLPAPLVRGVADPFPPVVDGALECTGDVLTIEREGWNPLGELLEDNRHALAGVESKAGGDVIAALAQRRLCGDAQAK